MRYAVKVGEIHLVSDKPISEDERREQAARLEALLQGIIGTFTKVNADGRIDVTISVG